MYVCLNRGTAGAQLPFEEFVKLSADAGFHGCDVDMVWGVKQGASALRDLLNTHHQKPGGWGPGVNWREDLAKMNEGLGDFEKQAKVAGELKYDSCATWIMPSSQRSFSENWKFHVERLRVVAKVLADHGLRFGMEFVAPYHLRKHFPHEFIFTPGQMLELAAEVGPNVGLLVDAFHVHASGLSQEAVAEIPKDKIVLCHVNDCPKVPIYAIQDSQRLIPGDGVIDLATFFRSIRKTGYTGPVSLEIFNADLKAMAPRDAATEAWQGTKRILDAAGV
ncbi:MAG TPA: sugar phosphate isomerase/epimerase [Tepidisphaeraceae bacterium]|nr:sugar phosphate isomerase/epimerase [Tepidisphaeraceae bacterium]